VTDFVFDESSYIRGLYADRTGLEADRLASRLLQILQVEHRWILTIPILVKYLHQIKQHATDKGQNANALIRSPRDILRDSERHVFLDSTGLKPVPGQYDHNDDPMVEAAAAVPGSWLITLDNKLIRQLSRAGIPHRYGFAVFDVGAALDRLSRQTVREE
jgi:hypothetical protein